jgi:hypothetical protein
MRRADASNLADSFGRPPTDEEADVYHRELLLQVELVTIEQAAALGALARHHGLERVLAEGLTAWGLEEFLNVMDRMRTTERELAGLRKQRAGSRRTPRRLTRRLPIWSAVTATSCCPTVPSAGSP